MSSIHPRALAMAASRVSRLSGLIDRSVQGALETNSVRLCGREVDGKWSDVATRQEASLDRPSINSSSVSRR